MEQQTSPIEQKEAKNFSADSMEPKSVRSNKNLRFFFGGFLFLLLSIFVAAAGFGAYRVYAQTATDSVSLGLAKMLRLPILKVNGASVRYADYVDDLKAISALRDYDRANNGPGAALTDDQMSDQVLWRMVNNILIKNAAVTFNLKVEDKDLDELKAQVLKQFKTAADADAELKKRYGWNMSIYEIKVMRPFILQNKLAEKIQLDQQARDTVREEAEKLLARVKSGEDFAELAKKYGEDGTAPAGGSLGWFGRGEMVPQFESAAYALKKGEISPALVETPYGYHVIKVEDRKTEKVKDKKGKLVDAEKILASHILLRFPSLETYMDKLIRQANIHLYGRVHNPFANGPKT